MICKLKRVVRTNDYAEELMGVYYDTKEKVLYIDSNNGSVLKVYFNILLTTILTEEKMYYAIIIDDTKSETELTYDMIIGIKIKNIEKGVCSSLLDIDNKSEVMWVSELQNNAPGVIISYPALDIIKSIVYAKGVKTIVSGDTLYIGNLYSFFNTLYYLKDVLIDKDIIICDDLGTGSLINDINYCNIFFLYSINAFPINSCCECNVISYNAAFKTDSDGDIDSELYMVDKEGVISNSILLENLKHNIIKK